LEQRLTQLDRLIADLIAGRFRTTTFQPWEVELLLDIQSSSAGRANRKELLRRYQRAAHRWYFRGGRTLLLFSDYLAKRHRPQPVDGAFGERAATMPQRQDAGG
jgi:hypothetical protein